MRVLAERMLKRLGYTVLTAQEGKDALGVLDENVVFIQKPFTLNTLALRLHKVLDQEFFVVKGFVEISKQSHSGWAGTIRIAHTGDFVAIQNLSKDKRSSITIEAIMGEAPVVIINREALLIMQVMAGQHRNLAHLLVYSG